MPPTKFAIAVTDLSKALTWNSRLEPSTEEGDLVHTHRLRSPLANLSRLSLAAVEEMAEHLGIT